METPNPSVRVVNLHTDAPGVFGYRGENSLQVKDPLQRNDPAERLILQTPSRKDHFLANGWDLPRALAGGEKLVNIAAFLNPPHPITGDNILPSGTLREAYEPYELFYADLVEKSAGQIIEISSHLDLDVVLNSNSIGLLRSIEGVYGSFSLQDMEEITKKAKIITLMWNLNNEDTGHTAITSGTPDDKGLSEKGKDLVRLLSQDRGVAVCLSHASDKTAHDVLDITEQGGVPAIATHSGSRFLIDHKRNLTDDLAQRITAQGGIIGIPAVPMFVGNTVSDFADHIEHFANLGLIESIAFGPDFDGVSSGIGVKGVEDAEVAGPNIAKELRNRGFSEAQIAGVLGENALQFIKKYLFTK